MAGEVSRVGFVHSLRRWWLPFLALTLLLMWTLSMVGSPLITGTAPRGIVSYELAGSVERANEVLNSWDEDARKHAAFSLGLDFLYIVAYATTISVACAWAGEVLKERGWPLAGLGWPLTWGAWGAGLLDAVENIGLTSMLLGSVLAPWPTIAFWCATFKFALIAIGLLYAAYGGLAWIAKRISR